MEEPIEQIPEADWVDQDLLTRDLAGSLLDDEIVAERGRLERIERGDVGDDILLSKADTERRLAAMIEIRKSNAEKTRG